MLNFPSGWKSLAAAYYQYLPSDTLTYEFVEPLTRLEIRFWNFSESRLEIIIEVRSRGFYLYFISLHLYGEASLPLKGGLGIFCPVTRVRVVGTSLNPISDLYSRVLNMNNGATKDLVIDVIIRTTSTSTPSGCTWDTSSFEPSRRTMSQCGVQRI